MCFQKLSEELNDRDSIVFHYIVVDLRFGKNIVEAFKWIKETLKSVDVLVNSAAVLKRADLLGIYALF